jgi:hypothetical protein
MRNCCLWLLKVFALAAHWLACAGSDDDDDDDGDGDA